MVHLRVAYCDLHLACLCDGPLYPIRIVEGNSKLRPDDSAVSRHCTACLRFWIHQNCETLGPL